MPYNIDIQKAVIFNRYFAEIETSTSEFQKAILPLLNSDWDKNSELLITKLQSFADRLENDTYRECIDATKDYINSRDFIAPNKYETTSYFYDALQYTSESPALKNLNQKLDQLMQDIPQKNISWSESFENLWCKTVSTLFSAFDFAKDNPIATTAALLYGQTVLASAFPAVFKLSSLDGANGFKINGEAAGDHSGISVSSVGDINGDEIDDLIIGAYEAGLAGSSYVIFGKNETWVTPLELSTLNGVNGFKINGEEAYDSSGYSVSAAGDINGDGVDDLIIGAPGADPRGNSSAGASYVIFGKNGSWITPLELSMLNGTNGFKINGEAEGDRSGISVSSAGDINGDGIDDLIIGADKANPSGKVEAGSSYVIFGHNGTWTTPFELSTLNGANGFKINGEAAGDYSGYSVSSAGDINGDGIADLIIGAYKADPSGKLWAGSSYVIFGKSGTWISPFELSSLNGISGFKINGRGGLDRSGFSVSGAGDINGDGIDDLIIGAPEADSYSDGDKLEDSGLSFVIFGKHGSWTTPLEFSVLNGIDGFKINGEWYNAASGYSVSAAGDINGDGIDDIIIGDWAADPDGKSNAGSSYVVFGRHGKWPNPVELSALNGTNGFRIDGEADKDWSGCSVSYAGDINGDGIDDVIIGAYKADPHALFYAGSSYVIFGNKSASIQILANKLEIENHITLLMGDNVIYDDQLIFNISNLENGQFEFITDPGIPVFNFTQQQLKGGLIRFVPAAYHYTMTANYGRQYSEASDVQVSFYIPPNSTCSILSPVKSEESLSPVEVGVMSSVIGGIICSIVTFMAMKYLKCCAGLNKRFNLMSRQIEQDIPLQPQIEMGEMDDDIPQEEYMNEVNRLPRGNVSPSAPRIESYDRLFPNRQGFFQPIQGHERKEENPKFNWESTHFDAKFVEQAKDIVLEPNYMCPVLERPMYDAVYIKVQGDDKLLAVSDEIARAWLIKKKQTTCPIRNLPVETVLIATDLRKIIYDVIRLQLDQSILPPVYANLRQGGL